MKRVSIKFDGAGLYILQYDNGVKIGISSCIRNRIKDYKSPWLKPILYSVAFSTKHSKLIEALLKKRFRSLTSEGSTEFFYGVTIPEVIACLDELPIEQELAKRKVRKELHSEWFG